MVAIDQLVPTLSGRDAIGAHTLHVRDVILDMGAGSEIFALHANPGMQRHARSLHQLPDGDPAGRWLLYQHSIGSEVGELWAERPEGHILNYHNVTPPELFERWEPLVGDELRLGRNQLARFAPLTDLAIAVSAFNHGELTAAGYDRAVVAPVLFDVAGFDRPPDKRTIARLRRARRSGSYPPQNRRTFERPTMPRVDIPWEERPSGSHDLLWRNSNNPVSSLF